MKLISYNKIQLKDQDEEFNYYEYIDNNNNVFNISENKETKECEATYLVSLSSQNLQDIINLVDSNVSQIEWYTEESEREEIYKEINKLNESRSK